MKIIYCLLFTCLSITGFCGNTTKGYWEKDCPVRTDRDDVKATIYQKDGESLISVAIWAEEPVKFSFQIDWNALGIDPEKAILVAPYIKDFQEARTFRHNDSIPVEPEMGWLFYLRENNP
jgi:hypothetical protein